MAKVLLLSRESDRMISALVRSGGHDPTEANSLTEGYEVAKTLPYGSIIVTEHNLEGGTAKDLMAMLEKEGLPHPVIIHSEDRKDKDVREAKKSRLCAEFFFTAQLDQTLLPAINKYRPGLIKEKVLPGCLFQFKGEEADLLMCKIGQMGPLEVNVAISGEIGLGKERVAKALHEQSPRSDKPIVFVKHHKHFLSAECQRNCEECYLHKCIAEAKNGTLVLTDLHLFCKKGQAIIQSVLYDPEHNIRIIATTNKEEMVAKIESGEFDRNLWYQLSEGLIELPPLRECPTNIEWLSKLILAHFSETHDRPLVILTDDALAVLKSFAWPGNVMQLNTVLTRAAAVAKKNKLVPKDFIDLVEVEERLENESEEDYVIRILSTSATFDIAVKRYNKSRRTLHNRISQFGLDNRGRRLHPRIDPAHQRDYSAAYTD